MKLRFNLYLEHCAKPGDDLKIIDAILERQAIEKILTHPSLDFGFLRAWVCNKRRHRPLKPDPVATHFRHH